MDKVLRSLNQFLGAAIEEHPFSTALLALSVFIGLCVWALVAGFGWLGTIGFCVMMALACALNQGSTILISIVLVIGFKLTRLLLWPLATIWWAGDRTTRSFQIAAHANPLQLFAVVFLLLFALTVLRRAIQSTLNGFASVHIQQ